MTNSVLLLWCSRATKWEFLCWEKLTLVGPYSASIHKQPTIVCVYAGSSCSHSVVAGPHLKYLELMKQRLVNVKGARGPNSSCKRREEIYCSSVLSRTYVLGSIS